MSKPKVTLVKAGQNKWALPKEAARQAMYRKPRLLDQLVSTTGEIRRQAGEEIYSFRWFADYAARSRCLELCSIETGAILILSRFSKNRIRGLIASLRRAHRNTSMKKTAAPQTLANANDPITLRLRAMQGPRSVEGQLTDFNEN